MTIFLFDSEATYFDYSLENDNILREDVASGNSMCSCSVAVCFIFVFVFFYKPFEYHTRA